MEVKVLILDFIYNIQLHFKSLLYDLILLCFSDWWKTDFSKTWAGYQFKRGLVANKRGLGIKRGLAANTFRWGLNNKLYFISIIFFIPRTSRSDGNIVYSSLYLYRLVLS